MAIVQALNPPYTPYMGRILGKTGFIMANSQEELQKELVKQVKADKSHPACFIYKYNSTKKQYRFIGSYQYYPASKKYLFINL